MKSTFSTSLFISSALLVSCASSSSYDDRPDAISRAQVALQSKPNTSLGVLSFARQYPVVRDAVSRAQALTKHSEGYRLANIPPKKKVGWRRLDAMLDITLPSKLGEPLRLEDELDRNVWIEVRVEDVEPVEGELHEAALVHRHVAQDTDVIHVAEPGRVEEIRMVYSDHAPKTARYRIKTGPGVSKVIERNGTLEVLDAQGHAKIRSEAMFVVDAKGEKREVKLELSVAPNDSHSPSPSGSLLGPHPQPFSQREKGVYETPLKIALSFPSPSGSFLGPHPQPFSQREKGVYETPLKTALSFPSPSGRGARGEGQRGARGEGNYLATATWTTDGMSYPIAIDPGWKSGASLPKPRYAFAAALTNNNEIIISGGFENFNVESVSTSLYNIVSNTWMHSPELPEAPIRRLYHSMILLPDNRLLTVGGVSFGRERKEVEIFDLTTKTWSTGSSMLTARMVPAIAWLPKQKRVLVAGGTTTPNSEAEWYMSSGEVWFGAGTPKISERFYSTLSLLKDGRVLLAGGQDNKGNPIASTEIFDPEKPTQSLWSEGPSMGLARTKHRALELANGLVMMLGSGTQYGTNADSNTMAEIFDGTRWKFTGPMSWLYNAYQAVPLKNGQALLIGGLKCLRESGILRYSGSKVTELYSPETNSWRQSFSTQEEHGEGAAFVLPNYRVLLIGGYQISELWKASSVEILEPGFGIACSKHEDCALGYCADGVCCDTPCTGTCESCNELDSQGTCVPINGKPRGNRPACVSSSSDLNVCQQFRCYGDVDRTQCTIPKVGTICEEGSCTNGVTIEPGRCSNEGKCKSGKSVSCLPYVCGDKACKTSCTTNNDCVTRVCNVATKQCESLTPIIQGEVKLCQRDSDCASGYCADGVCCDTACKDKCHSCALLSSLGKCTQVPAGMDLRNDCQGNNGCESTCNGQGQCGPASAGSLCAKSECTSRSTGTGAGYCDALRGACVYSLEKPFNCNEYACEPALGACYTQCQSNEQCADNYVCDVGSKRCVTATNAKSGCGCQVVGASSASHTLLGFLSIALTMGVWRRRRTSRI